MKDRTTFRIVQDIINENFGIGTDNIKMESQFKNDLGLDSMDMADLIIDCEVEFRIKIDDNMVYDLDTVGKLVSLINEKS